MAVELCQTALWIESVEPGKPLSFLDAHIQCGDSLIGVWNLDALSLGIPDDAYKPLTGDDKAVASALRKANKSQRDSPKQLSLLSRGSTELVGAVRRLEDLPEDELAQVEAKAKAFESLRKGSSWWNTKIACDLYVGSFFRPKFRRDGALAGSLAADVPTTSDVWGALNGQTPENRGQILAIATASEVRALHWPLAFPQVFARGGFDCAVGNPPWERIKLQEQEFFAVRAPVIANASNKSGRERMIAALASAPEGSTECRLHQEFNFAKRTAEASRVFVRTPTEAGGRFPLTGTGDVNTYALFAELFATIAKCAGVIVPTGIATDATTAPFFSTLVASRRLEALIDFENRERLFIDVYFRVRFCLLTISNNVDRTRFACLLTDPAQLSSSERNYSLSPSEIQSMNPNTNTIPAFRAREDALLTKAIYKSVPVLIEDGKVSGSNAWGISFFTMFHMSSDSALFMTAHQLGAAGFIREGRNWVDRSGNRFLPLFEGKMIHHFNHRYGDFANADDKGDADFREIPQATAETLADPDYEPTARYWVPEAEVSARIAPKGWTRGWLAGWRDITNVTNERTMIAGVMPLSAVGHKFPLFFTPEPPARVAAMLAVWSSLTFDYVARQKVGGTSMTYFYLKQLPMLPPSAFGRAELSFIVPRCLELTYTSNSIRSWAVGLEYLGPPFRWDDERRSRLRAELDAYIARLYGLTQTQMQYILDPKSVMGPEYPSETYRVLQERERRNYGEYRTARLVLEAWKRIERGEL